MVFQGKAMNPGQMSKPQILCLLRNKNSFFIEF